MSDSFLHACPVFLLVAQRINAPTCTYYEIYGDCPVSSCRAAGIPVSCVCVKDTSGHGHGISSPFTEQVNMHHRARLSLYFLALSLLLLLARADEHTHIVSMIHCCASCTVFFFQMNTATYKVQKFINATPRAVLAFKGQTSRASSPHRLSFSLSARCCRKMMVRDTPAPSNPRIGYQI